MLALKRLPRTIWLLGLASLLNDASSELVAAVLPLYLAQLGGIGLGIGLIGGLEEATRSLLSLASGYGSDRAKRRRPFLLVGYGLSALAKTTIAATGHWGQVLGLRVADRAGKAIRTPPRDALIAAAAPPAARGLAFGFHRALDTTGALVGALAALVAVWAFQLADLRRLILVGGLLGFASLLPLLALREGPRARLQRAGLTLRGGLRALPGPFRRALVALSLFSAGNLSYLFFLLAVNRAYSARLALGMPLLMYVLFNLSYALLAAPLGSLSDRWGRSRVVRGGFALFALVSLGFVFNRSTAVFVVLFLLYGVAVAALEGNQRALVADLVPAGQRGLGLGVFHTAVGLSALLGNAVAGWLWQTASLPAAFGWAATLSALGALALGSSPRTRA